MATGITYPAIVKWISGVVLFCGGSLSLWALSGMSNAIVTNSKITQELVTQMAVMTKTVESLADRVAILSGVQYTFKEAEADKALINTRLQHIDEQISDLRDRIKATGK